MPYKTLTDITEKQEQIIELVYKFRFINRKQIQTILAHKDARRINAWLKDLVEKNYLGRIYSHKLLENTKPAVYYLNNHGILWSKRNMGWKYRQDDNELSVPEIKKFYTDKHASESFQNHCLAICAIYLQFKNREKTIPWEYEYLTKTELLTSLRRYKDFEEKRGYLPDVYIDKMKKSGKDSTSFLLEFFVPHIPQYALEYKVRQYLKLHDEGDWGNYKGLDGKFPKIILILPTQRKLSRLASYIQERLDESFDIENIIFLLTTYEKVMEKGVTNDAIWEIIRKK